MSDSDPLDLSARDLMQSWVNDLESPQSFVEKKYRDYEDRGGDQRGGGKGKGRGRSGFGGGGGNRGGFSDRDKGRGGQGGRGGGQGGRGGPEGRDRGGKPWDNKRGGRDDRRSSGPPRDPAPQFSVSVEPSQETVEALAKHIRNTGRAYSMVDVARMVMASRDRYQVAFQNQVAAPPKKKKASPKSADAATPEVVTEQKAQTPPKQKVEQERPMLVRCKLDGSLWLTREEAVRHVLSGPLIEEFYQVEEVEVEAPKGSFSVMAVCGMSGTMLGPPNHHEYQTKLNKLYRERFSNMGFERFKSRIEMKRDEETIEAWKSSVSTAKHYRIKPPEVKKDEAAPAEDGAAPPADAAAEPASAEVDAATATETPTEVPEVESATAGAAAAKVDAPTEAEPVAEEAVPSAESEAESDAAPSKTGEGAVENEGDATAAPAAEDSQDGESEPVSETAAEPEVVLSSERELEQHFRENFAKRVFREVGGGVVPGDVPGQNMSAPLLEKLKRESEFMRRGFPLPLIQTLCRRFEKVGLKFFKRNKKELYVSSARPRPISGESGMTDRIRQIVEHVRIYPNVKVPKLLESVIDGFIAPRNEEEMAGHKSTDEEMFYLRDIHWLTKEGYLIEYSSGELVLGHAEPNRERPAKKKTAASKAAVKPKAKRVDPPTEAEKVELKAAPAPVAGAAVAPVAEAEVSSEAPVEPKSEAVAETEAPASTPTPAAGENEGTKKPTEN